MQKPIQSLPPVRIVCACSLSFSGFLLYSYWYASEAGEVKVLIQVLSGKSFLKAFTFFQAPKPTHKIQAQHTLPRWLQAPFLQFVTGGKTALLTMMQSIWDPSWVTFNGLTGCWGALRISLKLVDVKRQSLLGIHFKLPPFCHNFKHLTSQEGKMLAGTCRKQPSDTSCSSLCHKFRCHFFNKREIKHSL